MKNGILFFFHMGLITTAARIAVIPSFIMIFRVQPMSPSFFFFSFICVVSFFTSFIHAPSDRSMIATVEKFRKDVREQMFELCIVKDEKHYAVLAGYEKRGNMRLCRRVGTDVVYPHPVYFISARKDHLNSLLIATKDLTDPAPADFHLTNLNVDKDISITASVDPENDEVAEITLKNALYPDGITMFAKNDYHFREFLKSVSEFVKESR